MGHQASILRLINTCASLMHYRSGDAESHSQTTVAIQALSLQGKYRSLSSTRAEAELISGAMGRLRQPSNTNIFRSWRAVGHTPASRLAVIFFPSDSGNSGLTMRSDSKTGTKQSSLCQRLFLAPFALALE
jgi:hypothetical protein